MICNQSYLLLFSFIIFLFSFFLSFFFNFFIVSVTFLCELYIMYLYWLSVCIIIVIGMSFLPGSVLFMYF